MMRTLIIGLLTFLPFFGQGQTSNITYTENNTGGYSFSLFSGILPANTVISSIIWDFNDGTVVSGGTNLNAFHQYAYASGTYSVEVSYVMDINGVLTNESGIETFTISNWDAPMICPVATFVPIKTSDWCGTGELTLGWVMCDAGVGWTADYVVWNMGDGQTVTTQGSATVVHSYQTNATVTITAVAYFIGPNGETCSSIIMNAPGYNHDPCILMSPGTIVSYPYLEIIDTYFAQPDLYINSGVYCQTSVINFYDAGGALPGTNNLYWSYKVFVDGLLATSSSGLPPYPGSFFQATLPSGDHLVELVYTYDYNDKFCSSADGLVLTIDSCGVDTCDACNAFRPEPDEPYWISAWVKETHPSQVKTYTDAHIRLSFTGGTPLDVDFFPTGDIIEGWQRIVGSFTIPTGSTSLDLHMKNNGTTDAFFDDIRFHPFNASFKSYVYDPETLWLTAELDDNNYATFYEYDQEGQLIRIKKETSRGVMTIQESSSSNPKSE